MMLSVPAINSRIAANMARPTPLTAIPNLLSVGTGRESPLRRRAATCDLRILALPGRGGQGCTHPRATWGRPGCIPLAAGAGLLEPRWEMGHAGEVHPIRRLQSALDAIARRFLLAVLIAALLEIPRRAFAALTEPRPTRARR